LQTWLRWEDGPVPKLCKTRGITCKSTVSIIPKEELREGSKETGNKNVGKSFRVEE
jgi:hypothetical protein